MTVARCILQEMALLGARKTGGEVDCFVEVGKRRG
jgi:hypothetical protein